MQLNEFRALLANDGFAATFQTIGQYRTELLRAIEEALRAQTDAPPTNPEKCPFCGEGVAKLHFSDGLFGRFCDHCGTDYAGSLELQLNVMVSEASAPGLSDDEIESIARECEPTVTGMHPEAVVEIVRACLTRASTATVAEPSEKIESLETHVAMLKGANKGLVEVMRRKESASIEAMVNRFLGWKLPNDFMPDCGISFDRAYGDKWGMPSGTNLFTADQARAMFEYAVSGAAQQQAEPGADERAAFEAWASKRRMDLRREANNPDEYLLASTADACVGWQARAAQSGQRALLPNGYSIKRVDGHGWIIQTPSGGKWVSHDNTPSGDFFAALVEQSGQRAGVAADVREVIAAYVADERRYLDGKGEPYGSISTDIGLRARALIAAAPTQQQEGGS